MKQITLALLLAVSSTALYAGERNPQQQAIKLLANQNVDVYTKASASVHAVTSSNSSSSSNSTAQTGSISIDAHQDSDLAASPTATGSSNTTADCWRYDSTSVSFIFAGFTKALMIRDLTCVLGKPLNDEQKIALCLESADYRKVREISGKPCSK